MLRTVLVAPVISHCSSISVVCALHSTGDGGPVNLTTVNVVPGSDEDVVAGGAVVVTATLVLVVVGGSVVVVLAGVILWPLLLQAASTTTNTITKRRIRPWYVVCVGCLGSSILRNAT